MQKETYVKKLTHTTAEAANPNTAGWGAGDLPALHFRPEGESVQDSFLLWGHHTLVLFGLQLAGQGPPMFYREQAPLLAQNPLIHILISSKNTLTETSRIMFHPRCEHCGPGKLAHKINHHIFITSVERFRDDVLCSSVPVSCAEGSVSFLEPSW